MKTSPPSGLNRSNLETRLLDLDECIRTLAEDLLLLQVAMDRIRKSAVLQLASAPGFQTVEALLLALQNNCQSFEVEVKAYRDDLNSESLNHSPEAMAEEYDNINNQILKVSQISSTVQRITADLPEFIRRNS